MKHKNLRGGDLHSPSSELIENNTGSTIGTLTVVTFNGMGTLYPQVRAANSNSDIVRGVAQSSILTGTTGYITSLGFLNGVNTSAWPVNTTLYCDNAGNLTSTVYNLPIATVLNQDATNGIIYVNSTGITQVDLDGLTFPDALSLELAWDILYASNYAEPSYDVSGKITAYNIWDTSAKAVHIFSKVFTYTGSLVTSVLITQEITGHTLLKTLVYNGSGQLINITRAYST